MTAARRTKRPPYAAQLDPDVTEIRAFLGYRTAWRYASTEAGNCSRRCIVMEPGQTYDLSCVSGRDVLLTALDNVAGATVKAAAIQLLEAGAKQVACISPSGKYHLFCTEAA